MMTTLHNRVSALFADPLHTMLSELQPEFSSNGNGHAAAKRQIAPLSLWEDGQSVQLEIDVPGIALEDLDVSIHKGQLTIKGQRKLPSATPEFSYQERYYGEFERTVMLNDWVDPNSIQATLRDGVLHLTLSKRPEAQRQKVAITNGNGDVRRIETT